MEAPLYYCGHVNPFVHHLRAEKSVVRLGIETHLYVKAGIDTPLNTGITTPRNIGKGIPLRIAKYAHREPTCPTIENG